MFISLSTSQILAVLLVTVTVYLLVVAVAYSKRFFPTLTKPVAAVSPALAVDLIGAPAAAVATYPIGLGTAIGHPEPLPEEHDDVLFPEDPLDDQQWPFIEDQQVTLLKEAELVVEKIQDVLNHIASRPANPEEVYTKIQAVVSDYTFFFDTEYFDAINGFIAVAVQRDCDLQLTEDDLKGLWYAAAA